MEYEVFTRIVTEKSHIVKIELPIDMGESAARLTDRMVREGMANDTISGMIDGFEEDEEITCIMRDGKTIVPRHRKKEKFDTPETVAVKAKKASEIIDMFAPPEEA